MLMEARIEAQFILSRLASQGRLAFLDEQATAAGHTAPRLHHLIAAQHVDYDPQTALSLYAKGTRPHAPLRRFYQKARDYLIRELKLPAYTSRQLRAHAGLVQNLEDPQHPLRTLPEESAEALASHIIFEKLFNFTASELAHKPHSRSPEFSRWKAGMARLNTMPLPLIKVFLKELMPAEQSLLLKESIGYRSSTYYINILKALLSLSPQLTIYNEATDKNIPALLHAAENASLEALTAVLETNPDLNVTDKDGRNAVYLAATNNLPHCVQALLDAGISAEVPSHEGLTPVYAAFQTPHQDNFLLLLGNGASLDATKLSIRRLGFPTLIKPMTIQKLCENGLPASALQPILFRHLDLFASNLSGANLIKSILETGFDLNQRDASGKTAMTHLLDVRRANDASGRFPMSPKKFREALTLLIQHGSPVSPEQQARLPEEVRKAYEARLRRKAETYFETHSDTTPTELSQEEYYALIASMLSNTQLSAYTQVIKEAHMNTQKSAPKPAQKPRTPCANIS